MSKIWFCPKNLKKFCLDLCGGQVLLTFFLFFLFCSNIFLIWSNVWAPLEKKYCRWCLAHPRSTTHWSVLGGARPFEIAPGGDLYTSSLRLILCIFLLIRVKHVTNAIETVANVMTLILIAHSFTQESGAIFKCVHCSSFIRLLVV